MQKKIIIIILNLIITLNLLADLHIKNKHVVPKTLNIETVYFDKTPYFSAHKIAEIYKIRIYNKKSTGKYVFYFQNVQIKITSNSSYLMVGTKIKHMASPAVQVGNEIYVPVYSFLNILKDNVYSGLKYSLVNDDVKNIFAIKEKIKPIQIQPNKTIDDQRVRIFDIDYDERKNGLSIIISTNGRFSESDISFFFKDDKWFYLTIYGCSADSLKFSKNNPTKSLYRVETISKENSVQISMRLKQKFSSADPHYNPETKQIVIPLFLPLNEEMKKEIADKIAKAKKAWTIDTIVLDAGHGGKDSGAPGHWRYKHEKDLALDVVLRLGKLIEKKTDINVVYTRKTDIFIPLWKRTKIANECNGKLFISFHINAAKNKKANGFEIYLLRTGRSADAIRVAEAENSVIQLEAPDDKEKYKGYNNITNILANLVHSTNMYDSESFAEILSKNVSQKVPQKNRGVKQSGFFVLVGASMPKLLLELGYNTNRQDAKKLNNSRHRQLIAETIFNSIVEFKIQSDKSIKN